MQFVWSANDVDVKVGFTGNPTSVVVNGITYNTSSVDAFQNQWVGWSQGGVVNYDNKELLKWGGDATSGQGETAFFNAPVINSAPYPGQHGIDPNAPGLLPRTVTLQVNAGWYRGGGIPMTCNIYAYLGGTMSHVGTNLSIKVEHWFTLLQISLMCRLPVVSNMTIFVILYMTVRNTLQINWKGTLWTGTRSMRVPMRSVEETQKPYWTPTIVDTYSNSYRGQGK